MKLEIEIPYHVSFDTVYEMIEVLNSVRKPSEPHAQTVIKLQNHDGLTWGRLPPYSTVTPDIEPYYEITIPKAVPLVTPENCEYISHILLSSRSDGRKMSWCGKEINSQAHFISIDHAACSGGSKSRLMSCLDCNNVILKCLDNGWDEDHKPDEEDEE